MQIIVFILFVLVVGIVIYYINQSQIKKESKIIILVLTIVSILFAVFFEFTSSNKSRLKRQLINDFSTGKTLLCGDVEVNKKNFILNSRTLTFISKSEEMTNLIISIEICKNLEK